MTGLGPLLKKELKEQLRTHRLLIVGVVFLVFGLATPLLLRFMPELLQLAGEDIKIEMPPPTAAAAFGEYGSTLVQVGVLVAVLIAMGAVARERERGVAAMVLSKPVSSTAYVVAKLVASSLTFIAALTIGSAACYGYTEVLIEPAEASAFVGMNLLLALFFVVCLAVTLLCSSLFRSSLAAGGVALGVLVGQALLTQIPVVGEYLPGALTGWGTGLLSGPHPAAWSAVATSAVIVAICLFLSRRALWRGEL